MTSRQLSIWTMTPVFAVFGIICAVEQAWALAAISAAGVAFGVWRWWRLPKRWGG